MSNQHPLTSTELTVDSQYKRSGQQSWTRDLYIFPELGIGKFLLVTKISRPVSKFLNPIVLSNKWFDNRFPIVVS
jgi:hypothetical protein